MKSSLKAYDSSQYLLSRLLTSSNNNHIRSKGRVSSSVPPHNTPEQRSTELSSIHLELFAAERGTQPIVVLPAFYLGIVEYSVRVLTATVAWISIEKEKSVCVSNSIHANTLVTLRPSQYLSVNSLVYIAPSVITSHYHHPVFSRGKEVI